MSPPTETSFQGDFPVPPPYSVATSLPTYDEAEKAKAAAMAASTVDVMPRVSLTCVLLVGLYPQNYSTLMKYVKTKLFFLVFISCQVILLFHNLTIEVDFGLSYQTLYESLTKLHVIVDQLDKLPWLHSAHCHCMSHLKKKRRIIYQNAIRYTALQVKHVLQLICWLCKVGACALCVYLLGVCLFIRMCVSVRMTSSPPGMTSATPTSCASETTASSCWPFSVSLCHVDVLSASVKQFLLNHNMMSHSPEAEAVITEVKSDTKGQLWVTCESINNLIDDKCRLIQTSAILLFLHRIWPN